MEELRSQMHEIYSGLAEFTATTHCPMTTILGAQIRLNKIIAKHLESNECDMLNEVETAFLVERTMG